MRILPLISLVVVCSFISSCKGCKDPEPEPIGGKGGNATLKISPYHHDDPVTGKRNYIDSASIVYIKYNASDRPADGKYDDSVTCVMADGKPVAAFTGLKKGKYFLYGRGYDRVYATFVNGITSYSITSESTQEYDFSISNHEK